jgi:hypothetical protein
VRAEREREREREMEGKTKAIGNSEIFSLWRKLTLALQLI